MLSDLRLAVRRLRHEPGFTLLTALTLALGLGGTVTMFAAVNAAFLRPLPFPEEASLVMVYERSAQRPGIDIAVPLAVAREWAAGARRCQALAAYLPGLTANVSNGQDAARARIARITNRFFDVMQVTPARGRLFAAAETQPGAAPVVIISDALWTRLFGRRDDILAQSLRVDGFPVPIVGVMPAGFDFPEASDAWVSVDREGPDAYGSSTAHNFDVIARLSARATLAAAADDLTALTRAIGDRDPAVKKENLTAGVVPLRTDLLGPQASVVLIGLGAVLCVLLVACANVINLMLARGVAMETQTGIRVALGAGRLEIVRGVIAEGLVLSAAGAAIGTVLGAWGTRLVSAMAPVAVTGGQPLSVDARVLLVTVVVTTLAGVLCGSLPALRQLRVDVRQTLAAGNRTLFSSPAPTMRILVGVEVALAFVLLFGAGLLARTYANLDRVDLGFRTTDVTLASASLGAIPGSPYQSPATRRDYFARLDRGTAALPGVTRVGLAAILPLGFSPNGQFEVEGAGKVLTGMHYRLVGGDYFEVLGIPVRRGRALSRDDDAAHPRAAVVNEALVRLVFAGTDPIGQHIRMPGMDGGDDEFASIVGVVGDIHHRGPGLPPVPEAYFSYLQRPQRTWQMTLVVSSTAPAADLVTAIRRQGKTIDANVPLAFGTMADHLASVVAPSEFRATLLGVLGMMALALAAVGLVGVASYGVARREQEIGLRIALGATPASIQGLIVRSGLVPIIAGCVVGGFVALFVARTLAEFLFGVEPRDVWTLAAAAVVLIASGLGANWWPSLRAARVDPMKVLRG